jgi:hypothetical protein
MLHEAAFGAPGAALRIVGECGGGNHERMDATRDVVLVPGEQAGLAQDREAVDRLGQTLGAGGDSQETVARSSRVGASVLGAVAGDVAHPARALEAVVAPLTAARPC